MCRGVVRAFNPCQGHTGVQLLQTQSLHDFAVDDGSVGSTVQQCSHHQLLSRRSCEQDLAGHHQVVFSLSDGWRDIGHIGCARDGLRVGAVGILMDQAVVTPLAKPAPVVRPAVCQ